MWYNPSMDTVQLSTLITSSLIFLITITGAILLSIGISRKREKSTALGVLLLAFAIFLSIFSFPDLATTLAGFSTIAVAVFAGWQVFENIRLREENRRIHEEEQERESKRRCLEEIQNWFNGVIIVKSECSRPTGSPEKWRERATRARILVANREYVTFEAERIDSEITDEINLSEIIERLSSILASHEGSALSAPPYQEEIEQKYSDAIRKISKAKKVWRL